MPLLPFLSSPSNSGIQPENLYIELRDMAAVSFLMYTFAYILDVARKESLKGLDVSEGGQMNKMAGRDLVRSFTPKELLTIIEDNLDVLKEKFSEFGEEHSREMLMENLKTMQGKLLQCRTNYELVAMSVPTFASLSEMPME